MKEPHDLPVVHTCGHRAIYLILMEPGLQEAVGAEMAARPCWRCLRKARLKRDGIPYFTHA